MSEYMEYDWVSNAVASEIQIQNPARLKSEDKDLSLHNLKKLVLESESFKQIYSANISDDELLKFLNARYFNVDESFHLFRNYCNHRKSKSFLFQNYNLQAADIKFCLRNCLPGVIPSKDRKGRCVLLICASNWDRSYSLISIYRSILYCLDFLIQDVHNQTNGIVFIVDWTEFPFRGSMNLKPSLLRIMIEGLQDCFPAIYKGIHFVNQPWYVETALTCIKPFLKGDITNRIYFHGNNLSTLHEHIHKDILPTELGGEQPSFSPEIWLSALNPDFLTVM